MTFNKKIFFCIFGDVILILLTFGLSFYLRFEGALPQNFKMYTPLILPLVFLKVGSFILNNLYKKAWRYANVNELITIVQSLTIATVLFMCYIFFFRLSFPRSIIILDWMASIILISGSRFFYRALSEFKTPVPNRNAKKVLIVGAGDAGELVLKEFNKHKELNTRIVGFVDDDSSKHNMEIHGIKVLGNRTSIPALVDKYNISEVIIAIPSASGKEIKEIHQLCNSTAVCVKILPGVYEIINGDVSLSQIREVQVEDLLGREPVHVNMNEIAAYLTSNRILITGGGGSIGSEICRQVAKFEPEQLIIFDISENNVYEIDLELKNKFKELNIVSIIGSVRDSLKLEQVFRKYRPDVVFHAAAHKHVPLMEYNPEEAIKNNVFGTKNVAEIAAKYGVERFVMISTDKAVNPTNIMGASKRVAEMIVQDLAKKSKTKFVAVRFGNVLASRGSVIPLFRNQILAGGPVTVTHPEITRYFMTIPEASQLVIQAGAIGKGGEVFVLDMGRPVKIIDLARDLIELSGLKVGEDIEIKISGLRPGEKLYEELLSDKENTVATKHKRIMVAKLDEVNSDLLNKSLEHMKHLLNSSMSHHIVKVLVSLVVTYKPADLHLSVLKEEKSIS